MTETQEFQPAGPAARRTAPYADSQPSGTLRKTERPVTRGEHKDVFEEKTHHRFRRVRQCSGA